MTEFSRALTVKLFQNRPIPLSAELNCAPGELVALVGPSGSGKTTILRAIAGLNRPQEGFIACRGETWFDTGRNICRSPQRRRVGLVFQDYALFPHLSAARNVAAALGHLRPSERGERARALLARMHLAGLDARRPAELSGGQRQRVALARALAREPDVLLLDEPFSAVDQVTRRKLQRELVLLRRNIDIPMVLVTHDLDEATALADRMIVLHQGQTLQHGSPLEVMNRPVSAEVARLIDLGNIFEGIVVEHREATSTTLMRWRGYLLEARLARSFAPGSRVSWVIPPGTIVLHRRDRPSRGEHENPIAGQVAELAVMGETTALTLHVDGAADCVLNFNVSTHAARRNNIAVGATVKVSLLAEGIHLMPWRGGS
jgi:molybdate transport system ATP-binding protein